ncbi:MAG: hypothetical protein OXF02_02775 [Simkaniaceae bacterium]|nr:hypothetical protein [Simkaniaceae bacterium]
MVTKPDTVTTSQPVPEESDAVDAPLLFPKEKAEVARKVDGIGRSAIDCCPECFRTASMGDRVALVVLGLDGCVGIPCIVTATILGGVFGGTVVAAGAGVSTILPFLGIAVAGYLRLSGWCAKPSEETESVDEPLVRQEKETPIELEEVVIEQPKPESPSPEPAPEPAKGGWFSPSGWFAKPSEDTESVNESLI